MAVSRVQFKCPVNASESWPATADILIPDRNERKPADSQGSWPRVEAHAQYIYLRTVLVDKVSVSTISHRHYQHFHHN